MGEGSVMTAKIDLKQELYGNHFRHRRSIGESLKKETYHEQRKS